MLADVGIADGIGFDDVFFFATGVIAVAGAFGVLLIPVFKRLRSLLAWFEDFRDDWSGQDARPGVPAHPGVMVRLARIDGEFHDDGNGSLRSSVDKLADVVDGLSRQAHGMETRQRQVQLVVNQTADDLVRSINTREHIITEMTSNGEAVWKALTDLGAEMPVMRRVEDPGAG